MYEAEQLYIELTDAIRDNGGVRCQELPDAFFIEEQDPNQPQKIKIAKQVCGECPVANLCLEYAVVSKEQHGIWGGLTKLERRKLVRGGKFGRLY